METKELIKVAKLAFEADEDHHGRDDYRAKCLGEIIQKLLEFGELKKLVHDAVDPLIELSSYLLGVSDFQDGDINYGRE